MAATFLADTVGLLSEDKHSPRLGGMHAACTRRLWALLVPLHLHGQGFGHLHLLLPTRLYGPSHRLHVDCCRMMVTYSACQISLQTRFAARLTLWRVSWLPLVSCSWRCGSPPCPETPPHHLCVPCLPFCMVTICSSYLIHVSLLPSHNMASWT